MLYELVELFRRGVRRSREEVAQARRLIVYLSVEERQGGLNFCASVPTGYGECRASVLAPILGPQISKWSDKGLVIKGTQRVHVGGVMFEHMQAWALRPAPADATPSEPWYHPECGRQIGDDPPAGGPRQPIRELPA